MEVGHPMTIRNSACLALIFGQYPETMSFTKGPSITLTYDQVERLTEQLSEDEQFKLADKLSKKLARKKLLDLMDSMRPKKAVPAAQILKAAKEARKNIQARRRDEATAGRR